MEFYFEATVNGQGVSLYTTKRNEIMVEASDDGSISSWDILAAVRAKGFNTSFSTPSKSNFAKSCKFNNILITKREINDDTNNKVLWEFYLSELRASKKKLNQLLSQRGY